MAGTLGIEDSFMNANAQPTAIEDVEEPWMRNAERLKEIEELRRTKNAVILAHNYQIPVIQDLADFVGDSLELSRRAAATDAEVIVFCGVHFMAETAAILAPGKRVLIPDPEAGCSLASSITAEDLRQWKAEHPGAVVVSYVNTTAEVKAETDICCTSSNAVKVVDSIPADREILFCPDMFLGQYVKQVTGRRNMRIWPGECHVHASIGPEELRGRLREHPDAELLVHPECGCSSQCMYLSSVEPLPARAVHILSTSGMVRRAEESDAPEFVVATETGILHQLRKRAPKQLFVAASEAAVCHYMKMITLENLHRSLRDEVFEVRVPPEIADKARASVQRMVDIA